MAELSQFDPYQLIDLFSEKGICFAGMGYGDHTEALFPGGFRHHERERTSSCNQSQGLFVLEFLGHG